jgi:hypothetical protein
LLSLFAPDLLLVGSRLLQKGSHLLLALAQFLLALHSCGVPLIF